MTDLRPLALTAKAWPFDEARKVLKRAEKKGAVVFETGYGPSGLPHIGTFGEVARTSMVRRAFAELSDTPTSLIAFSDDMDGLRKAPGNVPNKEMLLEHLDQPLTKVPDPFGTHESFAHHNNARLCAFLDDFGFDYEFMSSSETYKSGRFDEALIQFLERYDDLMNVIVPTLGGVNEERVDTYSPFMPISPKTGKVLQVPTLERNIAKGTIVYQEPDGERIEVSVTGGGCKLQWKPDWAMRWIALGVDYEMHGKDLIPSAELGRKICRAVGARAPELFAYELFLDETGQKISKSKGNGLTIEEWLTYAAPESLNYFMYLKPKTAKRLYFDVIPKAADEYAQHAKAYADQPSDKRLENPAWHIHGGDAPTMDMPVSFSMLLNLASAASAEDAAVLWGFIQRYAPNAAPETHPTLDAAAQGAVRYFQDFVKPAKQFRPPTDQERAALQDLRLRLLDTPEGADAETLQTLVFAVGKDHGYESLRDWFKALYETLLGQSQGPRFGGFIQLFGVGETVRLIDGALKG